MLRLLRSRLVFIIAAAIVAVAPMVQALAQGRPIIGPGTWYFAAGAVLLLLVLSGGMWWAKKRGIPLLPKASTLWNLVLLAAAGDLLCNIEVTYALRLMPLAIFLCMASMCLLWGLLRRFSTIFWFIFFTFELAQRVGYAHYGARINSLVVAETLEASAEETFTYLTTNNMYICGAVLVISALLCWLMVWILRRERKTLALLNGTCLLGVGACVFALVPQAVYEPKHYFWPVHESYLLQRAWVEAIFHNHATIKQVESLPSPTEQASSLHTLQGAEGVVLVVHIGESVRADRMSLNGYERDTTPWLRTQQRMINFPHCISAACDTCQAQIAILTDARRDIYEEDPRLQPHTGSVLDLFEAHGFQVYSFFGKRNATHLKYDMVVRLLTRCSKERFHAPGSPWTTVPQMADLLRRVDQKQNLLWFINNEGSHTPFEHYDHTNPPFSPAGSSFERPAAHAQEVNNAYDATVHYTDEFVHRVTRLLQGRPWIYLYISDHGEYLGHDGIWGRAGLGESKRNYHSTTGCRVGFFILTSPELEQMHPHIAAALHMLQSHTDMVVGQEHIFHTLLGIFDLRTPHYRPELDLSSPQAEPYTGPQPAAPAP